ncbi:uncharacterized protein LOC123711078 [Pieris brassicae]|uniref:uncharacterized protein LOC123711078 n=1 Tax=Pieris brassicae TaxID=7116 RepID=UPI001E660043|nr:uncharacterized protein LOC123711078 [Pieris brassicae]
MSTKGIADVIRSEVNIFIEDEKEKRFNDNKNLEEQKHKETKERKNTVQINDQVKDLEKGVSEKSVKSRDGRKSKSSIGRQTLWIQFFGYGEGAGGGGGNDQPNFTYDPESRNYFVKFVFMILFVMLLVTIGIVALVLNTPDVKEFFENNYFMCLMISLGIIISISLLMMCSECSRRPPCNFVCLFIAVIGMSFVVVTMTCRVRTNLIFNAVIATAAVVLVCVLLACSSFDFTKWYLYVVVIAMAFAAVATIISISMLVMNIHYKPIQMVILLIGTIINCVVLIMELQTILGGRAVEIGESDYALAAFMLYTSIIELFLKILHLMDMSDD